LPLTRSQWDCLQKGCGVRKTIPVIRAAALIPLLKFLIKRRHPVEQILRDAGIGYVWIEDPYAPIPIKALEKVTARAAQLEGPDVACRAVTDNSLRDIAALGAIALGARSPREALQRVSAAMPFHCSHELISLKPGDEQSVLHDAWMLPIQPESLHVIQQFVAALVQMLLQRAVPDEPVIERLSIVPHPAHGLEHLKGWFPGSIVAAHRPVLEVSIRTAHLDAPYRQVARDRLQQMQKFPWQRLRDGTVAGSARFLLKAMLHDGVPTIERLSESADVSVRTLQRRFAEEGTSFSDLVEDVRRAAAMEALSRSDATIGDVAANVGYSRQSSLTRAVRRWTGAPPIALRARWGQSAD
jgi:AraC-like DNA-binding protein